MAEYIDREALKNDIAKSTEPFNTGSVFRAINRQIAADVAPVVRCKDCKHLVAVNVNGKGIPTCWMSGMEVAPAEFCSRGEKERRY